MDYESVKKNTIQIIDYFDKNPEMAMKLNAKSIENSSKAIEIINAFKSNNNVLIADNADKKLFVDSIWQFYYDTNQLCVDENVDSGDWESDLEGLTYYRNVDIPYMILDINRQDSCRIITYDKLVTNAVNSYTDSNDIFDWEEMLDYEIIYGESKWNPNWRNEEELIDDLNEHLFLLLRTQKGDW